MDTKSLNLYEIGMVGLGVMGRNLLLNMADHGFSVAGYDNDPDKVEALRKEAGKRDIHCTGSLQEFISSLRLPRAIILLVPAGAHVDSVINEMQTYLQKDDLIIDSGNSYFKDTNLRTLRLKEKGILFMGMGISGGEEGARHGASIMPGGLKEAYERVKPVLEAVAARVNGEPCVTYLGPLSAGHFVKMVHNGIEYGLMQLISETYALMKLVLGYSDVLEDIQAAFHANPGLLNLLLDPNISEKIKKNLEDLRQIVCQAGTIGIPIPGIMASLGYIDAYRSSWLPANLIQAQRDYFGAHTYERIDAKGTYHTEWLKGL